MATTITTSAELELEIERLKKLAEIQKTDLVEGFHATVERYKPANMIRNTISNVVNSPSLASNVIKATVGLGAGLLSKKVLIGSTGNIFKKMLGSIIEVTVGGAVAKNSEAIHAGGIKLFRNLFKSKNGKVVS